MKQKAEHFYQTLEDRAGADGVQEAPGPRRQADVDEVEMELREKASDEKNDKKRLCIQGIGDCLGRAEGARAVAHEVPMHAWTRASLPVWLLELPAG